MRRTLGIVLAAALCPALFLVLRPGRAARAGRERARGGERGVRAREREGARGVRLDEGFAAEVGFDPGREAWNEGRLGDALWYRHLEFDVAGRMTIRGLEPGPCRFRVFPDDLRIEPEALVAGRDPAELVVVRWKARAR